MKNSIFLILLALVACVEPEPIKVYVDSATGEIIKKEPVIEDITSKTTIVCLDGYQYFKYDAGSLRRLTITPKVEFRESTHKILMFKCTTD